MACLRVSVLLLLVMINGSNSDTKTSTSKFQEKATEQLAKLEAHSLAKDKKDKERFDTMLPKISKLTADIENSNSEMRQILDKVELGLKERQDKMELEQKKRYDDIVARLDQQDRYIEESRRISQCESARTFSTYQYQANYNKFKTCSANPYLKSNAWIVFQRRISGRVNFNRNWSEYKNGFGSIDDDFWLGLETLHKITSSGKYELYVVFTYKGKTEYAQYSSFRITGESDGYRLKLGAFVGGGAGDSLREHHNKKFSTPDKIWPNSRACAKEHVSGWWFTNCYKANLNGLWGDNGDWRGLVWHKVTKKKTASFSEMKIRRKN